MNISSVGTVRQKLGVGKWEKIEVFAIQKVAKTGNIEKGQNVFDIKVQMTKIYISVSSLQI